MAAIDDKYGLIRTERGDFEEHGEEHGDEPVFLFRSKDQLLPKVLAYYRQLCEEAGSPQHHLDGIDASIERIERWQADHFTQVPQSAPVGED